jgi:hypothetical protein
MATTISGTTVTFTDGSTWGGANGALTPDGNTSRTSQSYNIGHIILANTIFYANQQSFSVGGSLLWELNSTNRFYFVGNPYAGAAFTNRAPGVNTTLAADHPRHGSQSYFALGNYTDGTGGLAGSWRARGMACGAGINQALGFFVLMERVA